MAQCVEKNFRKVEWMSTPVHPVATALSSTCSYTEKCGLFRLDAGSSLCLYEEMLKEQENCLPLHVARLHSLDSEPVRALLNSIVHMLLPCLLSQGYRAGLEFKAGVDDLEF